MTWLGLRFTRTIEYDVAQGKLVGGPRVAGASIEELVEKGSNRAAFLDEQRQRILDDLQRDGGYGWELSEDVRRKFHLEKAPRSLARASERGGEIILPEIKSGRIRKSAAAKPKGKAHHGDKKKSDEDDAADGGDKHHHHRKK